MERTFIKDLGEHKGSEVKVSGWVDARRDHGKIVFIDLRDETGRVQMVALPSNKDAYQMCEEVRDEWVLSIEGVVNERPEKMINKDEENGDVELEIKKVEVLSQAQTPPFDIDETQNVEENVRLRYRYIDLRSKRMQRNLRVRSEFVNNCRNYLVDNNFVEIETPLLTKSTPEGSRDFVVPSRQYPGKFYALPQSPQQYKQLLMASGFEKYFQIARAVRDEDLRADRGFEHSQIDIEMAFVKRDDVLEIIEDMITKTVESMGYKIKEKPFPRISYKKALEKYGADKFDLRDDKEKEEGILAYAWVVDFPFFEKTDLPAGEAGDGGWTFSHNPFSMPIDEHLEKLLAGEDIENILTTQYDLVCNGYESGGGSIRAHKPEILEATYKVMGYSDKEIKESVGHMLEAFRYGTPPHGGIALGIERNLMNLTGEDYLREVQSFPMTRSGKTAVMDAPSSISEKHLKELGLRTENKENE